VEVAATDTSSIFHPVINRCRTVSTSSPKHQLPSALPTNAGAAGSGSLFASP